jgi:membrane protein implicated in regulation of membrane protease activity
MKGTTNWIILVAGIAAIFSVFIIRVPLKIVVPAFTLALLAMFLYDILKHLKNKERENIKSKMIVNDGIWLICGVAASIFVWFSY